MTDQKAGYYYQYRFKLTKDSLWSREYFNMDAANAAAKKELLTLKADYGLVIPEDQRVLQWRTVQVGEWADIQYD